ncbi:MAG: hypothetical protein KatS3mg051_0426 [Anaerolineae bacterium]|nr:MAG: hypothetical protein KatS3mg051_0426 [Anaerolineae bacterium]
MQTVLKGPSSEVIIGPDQPIVMIGERINPTGRKAFSAELQAGDLSRIPRDAQAQADAGARVLDVNVGAASVDEVALLPQAVRLVQDTVDLPVCIDSANPAALEAGTEGRSGDGRWSTRSTARRPGSKQCCPSWPSTARR